MRAVMIIAFRDFRDEEFFHTREELEKLGISVDVASSRTGRARGMLGATADVDISLDAVEPEKYDAVVFVGGSGSAAYFDDKKALSLAKRAYELGKAVGAICIAPVILARSGILKGKRATVWNGEFIRMLEDGGAKFTAKAVEVDGRIVTANGPSAAREFGRTLAGLLKG